MEENPAEIEKRKNSNLTVVLIFINIVLSIIFAVFGRNDGGDISEAIVFPALAVIILLGGYALTYHGKAYRAGKWLFAIALIIGLIFFGLLWYATQLGHAFSH